MNDPFDLTSGTAKARRDDPETSWQAAFGVCGIKETQARAWWLLRKFGPMTDVELDVVWHRVWPLVPVSPSGLRSRRNEVVETGLAYDTGDRRRTGEHKPGIVWAARSYLEWRTWDAHRNRQMPLMTETRT